MTAIHRRKDDKSTKSSQPSWVVFLDIAVTGRTLFFFFTSSCHTKERQVLKFKNRGNYTKVPAARLPVHLDLYT